jgi:tRNA threonylcarbamoyl adenosine modification protein (Sua5/YciO/YrdC/YwlC family)
VARYLDVHPDDPQPRLIAQAADAVRHDGVIAYPTDCSYALGWRVGSAAALERVRLLRGVDAGHHFTLACTDFSQVSHFARIDTVAFRVMKACTPGPYTFILPASREVPRRLQHPKKATVGVRLPANPVAQALVRELGEPLVTTTLILPGDDEPLLAGWEVMERLRDRLDVVIDAGDCSAEQTTVIDLSSDEPYVLRVGAGDSSRFL